MPAVLEGCTDKCQAQIATLSPGVIDHKMDRLGSRVRYDRLCSALGAPSYPVALLATTAWRSLEPVDRG